MSSPPTTLGQYQIIREIARSNDIVYEAYDPLMNRRVAIKELAVPPGSTPQQRDERISRFKREAQAAGTLNHPHIMTVFSFAEDAGRTFMAMEYLDGATLRNDIDTKGFITSERAVEVAVEVLEGLSHAHSKGVIHRDIKPDNIQILTTGVTKITDFGIARLTFQPNLTMDGQVFGTPSYMSPEQVVGKDIDARSDLFSVGVVLYEMISGTKPFSGDSVVSITYAIMNTDPPRPQQVGDAVWQVIHKAIDKSPTMRYSSAAEMANALREAYKLDEMGANLNPLFGLGNQPQPQTNPYQPYPQQPQVNPSPYVYNPYTNQQVVSPHQMAPQAPPVQNPYQQQSPYQQTPYQQQQQNPYPTYPQQQQYYNTGTYIPQNTMLPPAGFQPVYYPPPPRQPLMKPETWDFLKRLTVALIILGTVFALIIVGIVSIGSAIQEKQAEARDNEIVGAMDNDPRIPLDERIQKLEQFKANLSSPKKREEVDKRIAVLMSELGLQALKANRTADAEAWFQQAIAKDQSNPALYSYLGKLYETRAQNEYDANLRLNLWRDAGANWHNAWQYEPTQQKKASYGNGAAAANYNYASMLLQGGSDNRTAREALYDARATATPGSEVYNRVSQLLEQLR